MTIRMVQDTSEGTRYVNRQAARPAHPQSDDGWHHYRLPGTRIGLRVAYVILAIALAVIFADYEGDHGSLPVLLVVISALVWVFFVVVVERVSVKTGLEECDAGFVDRQNFGSRLLPLEQVDRFDHRKELTLNRVYAVMRDGTYAPLVGLQQGQRVVWRRGETRDIVGVLNERLHDRQEHEDD
jgi:hypothetical protein